MVSRLAIRQTAANGNSTDTITPSRLFVRPFEFSLEAVRPPKKAN